MAAGASPEEIYNVVASAFDVEFYLTIYDDVGKAGADPVRHYLDLGWGEGRDPAPWFSVKAYAAQYPETAGTDPFHHYLTQGWRQGFSPRPSQFGSPFLWMAADSGRDFTGLGQTPKGGRSDGGSRKGGSDAGWTLEREQLLTAFDPEYYLALYPDVASDGVDPLDHFLTTGWREGRAPSRDFSVQDYLEFNPDVAALGINPFLHYVAAGRSEGRLGVFDLGFRHRMIAGMQTMPERQARARQLMAAVDFDSASVLEPMVADLGSRDRPLHISFSHDDFTANIGGLQLCLQREAEGLKLRGIDHLHLFPASPWPTVRPDTQSGRIGVLWNGQKLGVVDSSQIAHALKAGRKGSTSAKATFAIHSLLGHAVGEVLEILKAANSRKGWLWIHDFTSLCAGFHLMRNDVADCGAPPPGSPACTICVYGDYRQGHVDAHARLVEALDVTIASPSVSAYETWRAATTAPLDTPHVIHPHATLAPDEAAKSRGGKGPLKVAYIGMTALHKGWAAFEGLAMALEKDERYAFLHLGSQKAAGSVVPFRQVSVSAQGPNAMQDALLEEAVDVVVLWSLCRETFSLAAHEAAAAGAFILTHADSGNIAAFAKVGDFGRVLQSEEDLREVFETGQATDYARQKRKPMLYDLTFSQATADLIGAD